MFSRRARAYGWSDSHLWVAHDRAWRRAPGLTQLSFGPVNFFRAGFGSNGRQLHCWGDLMRGELLRYDSASRRRESFLGGVFGHYLDTSADGRWMAFSTYPEDELWKSRSDGSQRIRLSRPGTLAGAPRWSPDGRSLSSASIPESPG